MDIGQWRTSKQASTHPYDRKNFSTFTCQKKLIYLHCMICVYVFGPANQSGGKNKILFIVRDPTQCIRNMAVSEITVQFLTEY